MPVGDWTVKQECLDDITDGFNFADGRIAANESQYTSIVAAIEAIGDANTKTACTKLYTLGLNCNKAIKAVISYYENTFTPPWPIPYFLDKHTSADPFILEWEDIVSAWIEAPKVGRLYTVLTLDELRRDSWDQEFISFRIMEAPS